MRFARVSPNVLRHGSLGATALRLFVYLSSIADEAGHARVRLGYAAAMTGTTPRHVRQALRQLERANLVDTRKTTGRANTYRLARQDRFCRVSLRAAVERLDATALRVLIALGGHIDEHGRCFPTKAELARTLGVYRRAVTEAILRLERGGWLCRLEDDGTDEADPLNGSQGTRLEGRGFNCRFRAKALWVALEERAYVQQQVATRGKLASTTTPRYRDQQRGRGP